MSERPLPPQQPKPKDKTTSPIPREDKVIKTEINGRPITPPPPPTKGVKELWY